MRHKQTRSFTPMILAIMAMIAILLGMGSKTSPTHKSALATTVMPQQKSVATPLELNQSYLLDVLRTHPKKEVSEVLWQKIAARDLRVRGLDDPSASGRFRPTPIMDSHGNLIKLMGTLHVPLALIDRARRGEPSNKSYLQFVLLHESVHYEQIASGRFSSEVILNPSTSLEECVAGWNLEREAYYRECQFAMSIGQDSIIRSYCSTLEPEAFDQNLYKVLRQDRTDNCSTFWEAELQK